MKILYISLAFLSCGLSAQIKVGPQSKLIDQLISTFRNLRVFDENFHKTGSYNFEDSVEFYSLKVTRLMSKIDLASIKQNTRAKILSVTGMKISSSNDGNLMIASWKVFADAPSPSCTNIAFYKNKKSKILAFNADTEDDFGNNVQIDTIIEISDKNVTRYLLIGSNKCDFLCSKAVASLYKLTSDSLSKCSRVFINDGEYLDDVEFDYVISDQIKQWPSFRIINNKLVCPIFDEEKKRQTGAKEFKIFF